MRSAVKTQCLFVFALVMLILLGVVENMDYTLNGAIYMTHYRTCLNVLVVFFSAAFFLTVVLYSHCKGYYNQLNRSWWKSKRRLCWFISMALLDTVALYASLLSSSGVGPALRTVLQQFSIPLSMVASYIFLKRTFNWMHILGAVMMIIGITLCSFKIFEGKDESNVWWSLLFSASCIPLALGGCLKEWVMTNPTMPININIVNAYVSLFQLIITLLAYPAGFYIQENFVPKRGIVLHNATVYNVTSSYENFIEGVKCGIAGVNTYVWQECEKSVFTTWVYIICVVSFNTAMLLVIRDGSITLFFIANAVTIAIVGILSTTAVYSFFFNVKTSFSAWQIVGICLVIAGTCIYTYVLKQEEQTSQRESSQLVEDAAMVENKYLEGHSSFEDIRMRDVAGDYHRMKD